MESLGLARAEGWAVKGIYNTNKSVARPGLSTRLVAPVHMQTTLTPLERGREVYL